MFFSLMRRFETQHQHEKERSQALLALEKEEKVLRARDREQYKEPEPGEAERRLQRHIHGLRARQLALDLTGDEALAERAFMHANKSFWPKHKSNVRLTDLWRRIGNLLAVAWLALCLLALGALLSLPSCSEQQPDDTSHDAGPDKDLTPDAAIAPAERSDKPVIIQVHCTCEPEPCTCTEEAGT